MNRPQPALVPRLARKSGRQGGGWLWMMALLVSVGLVSLAVADEYDTDNLETDSLEWTDEPAPESVGRAQLIPVDTSEIDESDDSGDSDLIWPEHRFFLISATQDPPFLVPLPEPRLVPVLPPVPLPPSDEPEPIEGPNDGTSLVPTLDPFCAECQSGTTAPDGDFPPGSMLVKGTDDSFGIGSRQVPFALFHIDSVAPLSQIRLRADFANGLTTPDRAERFWAVAPVGPAQPEREVNYQTFSVYSETGGDSFSAFTEVPLIFLSPDVNASTAGLGNITIGQKFLLTNPYNRRWQIAQIMRTYLPTGSASRGLGNELVAVEPGLLFRYRASERTYFHGELKYWMPFGGDPVYAGNVFQYGTGMSHVLWQTDERAVMSTLELIGSTIGDGQATLPDGTVTRANGDTFFSILPGLRTALGPSGDLGLLEVGISSGLTFGDPGWYESRVLFDVRWSY